MFETFPLLPLFLTCIPGLKELENVTGVVPQKVLFTKYRGKGRLAESNVGTETFPCFVWSHLWSASNASAIKRT